MFKNHIFLLGIITTLLIGCISQKEIDRIIKDRTILYPYSENNKWGFTNQIGELVIPCVYDTVNFFHYGLSAVKFNGEYGYLKTDGTWFIKPQFDYAENFDTNCANVINNGNEKRINRRQRKCKKNTFIMGGCIPPNECAKKEISSAYQNGKYAVIYNIFLKDKNGSFQKLKDTSDYVFDDVIEFSNRHIIVRKGKKYGLFEIHGLTKVDIVSEKNEIVEIDLVHGLDSIHLQYDELKIVYQNFANDGKKYEASQTPFKIGTKWGIISNFGKILIPPKYLKIKMYNWTLAEVEFDDNKKGYIDIWKKKEFFKRKTTSNNRAC